MVDQATARRRALIQEILGQLPSREQHAVAGALRAFAEAAGEVPDQPVATGDAGDSPGPGVQRERTAMTDLGGHRLG